MTSPSSDLSFGPEYPKIETVFKRDERNVIVPNDWTCPEFEYLGHHGWRFTEKVDGTNIRLHWNGEGVTIGGRTDQAQVPATLVANLGKLGIFEPDLWRKTFADDVRDVTVYGEGYGDKIQKGGMYRPDQALIVFDVKVGPRWLEPENVADVASKLELELVPHLFTETLDYAVQAIRDGRIGSRWNGVRSIEGVVGRPTVDLFNRRGERIITKIKSRDWTDYERRRSQ